MLNAVLIKNKIDYARTLIRMVINADSGSHHKYTVMPVLCNPERNGKEPFAAWP